MDFVVSKVAMSICALFVVSVLGGVLGNDVLFREIDELGSVLNDLSITLENAVWSGCEVCTVWKVPFLSDGGRIDISVRNYVFIAKAGERSASLRPACETHTWLWNGSVLNRTSVESLDANAPSIRTCSGQAFEIRIQLVAYEDQSRLFAFIRASA